jgi:hypothetical protein
MMRETTSISLDQPFYGVARFANSGQARCCSLADGLFQQGLTDVVQCDP